MVNLDREGRPLRPAITWLDQRRTEEVPPIGPLWRAAFRVAGVAGTMRHLVGEAEINWIRAHQPDVWDATDKVPAAVGLPELAPGRAFLFEGASALTEWFGFEAHPYDDSIGMPVDRCRYWEYLAAIAAVEQRRNGAALSAQADAILATEDHWRLLFSDEDTCFWRASEQYEEGGGADWLEPPYGIDLRRPDSWTSGAVPHARMAAPSQPVSLPPDCWS